MRRLTTAALLLGTIDETKAWGVVNTVPVREVVQGWQPVISAGSSLWGALIISDRPCDVGQPGEG
jgi:hypothetical protein